MLESAIPAQAGRSIDYDLLSHLFLMAYDGFVINRRLNDLRDIERLVETVCDMMMPTTQPERAVDIDRPTMTRTKASRTKRERSDQHDA